MAKQPNVKINLGDIVLGSQRTPASLVMVSDLTNMDAKDPDGVPWASYVDLDYHDVQKAALKAGILPEGAELQPHYAKDVLSSDDPDDDNYTIMAIVVPASKRAVGVRAVGMIRPDVTTYGKMMYEDLFSEVQKSARKKTFGYDEVIRFSSKENPKHSLVYLVGDDVKISDPENHGFLWFGAVLDPKYENASIMVQGQKASLDEVLSFMAYQRIQSIAEGSVVFGDSIPKITPGFRPILENFYVSDLKAEGTVRVGGKRVDAKDVGHALVTLTARPSEYFANGVPLHLTAEAGLNYLLNGYEAPVNGDLVRTVVSRLQDAAIERIVPYTAGRSLS